MSVVYKYELEPQTHLPLPFGAKVLSAGLQGGKPFLWVMLGDPDAPKHTRMFVVAMTGQNFDDGNNPNRPLIFIGTLIGIDGWMVGHVFEVSA